jgi:hypothetical protein
MTSVITRSAPPQRIIDVLNPAVRALLRSPLHGAVDPVWLMLHLTGRRTGRRYDIPLGYVELDGRLLLLTQHAWRANLRGGAQVEVTLRGRRRRMHAELVEDPDAVAEILHPAIERIGRRAARRQFGLTVTVHRTPTQPELAAAAREYHLAVVTLSPPP